jgi:predicted chitinase
MQGLTKKINGGTHGIENRIARTQLALDTLMA